MSMELPQFFYSQNHIWVNILSEQIWEIGITDYAQDLLGDIMFVELPNVGEKIILSEPFGKIDSMKTSSDLIAPATGLITEINPIINRHPEYINNAPYEHWIIRLRPTSIQTEQLMTAEAYKRLIS